MVEMAVLQTTCTKEPKIEDITFAQYDLDQHIQVVTNKVFTIEGHPGQVIGFIMLIHVSTPIISFISPTLLLAIKKHHNTTQEQFMKAIFYQPS